MENDNQKGKLVEKIPHHKISESFQKKVTTNIIHVRPCTQVWKLVKKIIPSIRNHISKTPGNGKSIAIWDDRIMGK